jgi:hypothetical protein
MTVDRATVRIMELDALPDAERRFEIKKILGRLRSAGWVEGYNEGRDDI